MDYNLLDDKDIVRAILNRNSEITIYFLYRKCYPLFKSIYDNYYTDCDSWNELVNEIYVYIMMPQKESGISKLASFGFRCSFTLWLKIITENYCHQLYAKKIDIVGENKGDSDRFARLEQSLNMDFSSLNMTDVKNVISQMPNKRYQKLIELRYLDSHSNEETATLMSMNMANYYNKHKLAKAQFVVALRKEGLL